MDIKSFLQAKSELTHNVGQCGPIVLSTRIRLARNLKEYPFPGRAKPEQKQEILQLCEQAILSANSLQKEKCINLHLNQIKDLHRQILVERHLISPEIATSSNGSGVIINKNQSISVMINEEDHLRIQIIKSGFQFKKAWKQIDILDTEIEKSLLYAFSSQLGYLTACPTNLGTGMRASVMMHLPCLVLSDQMEKIIRAVNQLGLVVRGLFGEGSQANGSVFQISNQQTLGESEEAVIQRLTGVLNNIIEQEQNARQKFLEKDKIKLFDKMGRAFGVLKNAHYINSIEAMSTLSLMRLAVDLGMIDEDYRILIDRLFIETQPGHIQADIENEAQSDQRDQLRAQLLRSSFANLPHLKGC